MKDLHGLTIGVVGLGDSGLSALRWLARRGARLAAIDSRTAPPHLAELAQLAPEAELRAGPFTAASLGKRHDLRRGQGHAGADHQQLAAR